MQFSTILPSIDGKTRKLHFPTGGSYPHELAPVGTVEHEMVGYHVAICYLDLVCAVVVGKGSTHLSDALFELLGNIRDHKLVQGVQDSPADRFRHSVRDGLGLFGGGTGISACGVGTPAL